MTPDGRKQPAQKDLEKILRCLQRVTGPTYLGILALEANTSLGQAEDMVDVLVTRGKVRQLTPAELAAGSYDPRAAVYTLV